MSKNVALAYCAENQNTAQEIDRQLSLASYHFQHFPCSKTTAEIPLSDLLSDYDRPILLIISDNFLKSAQCMSRALKLMQKKGQQILAVVIDGEQLEKDGSITFSPTNFDRVSDIIQYINHWQDRYLDLRRQKRQIEESDESRFNAHLKVMRDISSEVGEFLRVLRNSNHTTWNEFTENGFESFFAFNQDAPGWEYYQSLTSDEAPSADEDVIAEEPMADLDLSDIPGISLLEKSDAPKKIIFEIANETDHVEPTEGIAPEPLEEPEEELVPELSNEIITDEIEEEIVSDRTEKIITDEIEEESDPEPVEEIITDETEEETDPEPVEEIITDEIEEESDPEPVEEIITDEIEEESDPEPVEEIITDETEEEVSLSSSKSSKDIIEESEHFFAAQQIDEGFSILEKALIESPNDIDLRYHYAISLAQLKEDFSAASSQLEAILEIEPNNTDTHFLLGKIANVNNDYEAAVAHYKKTIELNGGHSDVYYQLGMLLIKHYPKRQKEAAKYLKKAIKDQPDNPEIAYNFGLLLHEQLNKPKKATKYLKKTVKMVPEHPFAHYDLALIYHQLGEPKNALAAYQKATEVNPELKTPENDEAFALEETPPKPKVTTHFADDTPETLLKASLEADTIEALKQNIYRLEEMMTAKALREEEEKAALALAAQQIPQKDEIVLITGATSGIGKATAKKFAANGYKLILNGRRIDRLEALKKELEETYNSQILILPFDVRDADAVKATFDTLEDDWKNIDILINNAGKAKGLDPIHEGQLHHWEEMIDTNIKGLLYLTRVISPSMVERATGHIINICSTAGKEVYPKGNVYCATKFAVDALTKAMRIDLHPYNIRVSQVSPGHVEETEFAAVRFDGDTEKAKIYEDFLPLTAKDVAETLYFIANQPKHVNIQDVLMMGTQQANSLFVNRSGREAL